MACTLCGKRFPVGCGAVRRCARLCRWRIRLLLSRVALVQASRIAKPSLGFPRWRPVPPNGARAGHILLCSRATHLEHRPTLDMTARREYHHTYHNCAHLPAPTDWIGKRSSWNSACVPTLHAVVATRGTVGLRCHRRASAPFVGHSLAASRRVRLRWRGSRPAMRT